MSTTLDAHNPRPENVAEPQRTDQVPGRVLPGYAQPVGFAIWLLVTGAVGALASFLLLYERVRLWNDPQHVTACDLNPWVSCGEVMQSWQSATFGFPNIFIGVVAFPLLIGVAVSLLATGGRMPRWYYHGLQAGAVFAFGFIIWLWYSAVYTIGVLCPYCMIVWAAVIPLFVVTTARNIVHGVIPASAGVKRVARDWWWVVVAVLYLLVFTSILLNFTDAFIYGF
ncbi:vitamin K epoxide reductase family protein [Nesterenkonia muleiensis]|uniref:vitamin K epoxide reductase family protein n=1 Tax=Nesterenkonia muleiensis TaxID=2282648 RepID=UPI000E735A43|nr:vitamin K epoxide reductase family protein [Nesterenkonia muleiensis]